MISRITLVLAVTAACAFAMVACGGTDDEPSLAMAIAPAPETDCWMARALAAGDTRATITSSGIERQYLLHVPPSYPPSYDGLAPAPPTLLIAFHGAGTTAQFNADMTALSKAADARGMVVAFPEAAGSPQVWNVFGSADPTGDLTFGADLIAHLTEKFCIDHARVYATGFSVGGGMALLLACERPELIAAVAPVAAPYVPCQADVPMIAFHGDQDPLAPYDGRTSPTGEGDLPAVRQAVADWAQRLGCEVGPAPSQVAEDVELSAYNGCLNGDGDGDGEALLYTVEGGGHTWPGAAVELPRDIAGVTTHTITATDLMLAFFESHRRQN